MIRRAIGALATALFGQLLAGTAVAAPAAKTPSAKTPSPGRIAWGSCESPSDQGALANFECAAALRAANHALFPT